MDRRNVEIGGRYLLRLKQRQVPVIVVDVILQPRKLFHLAPLDGSPVIKKRTAGMLSKHYNGCPLFSCDCEKRLAAEVMIVKGDLNG